MLGVDISRRIKQVIDCSAIEWTSGGLVLGL